MNPPLPLQLSFDFVSRREDDRHLDSMVLSSDESTPADTRTGNVVSLSVAIARREAVRTADLYDRILQSISHIA